MAQSIQIPVTKGKETIEFTEEMIAAFPEETYREIMFQGLKQVLNRNMSKITKKDTKDDAEMQSLALAAAQKNLEAMQAGKIRLSGGKAKKASGAEMTEARRLARNLVKDAIKAAGKKISHYEASEITKYANELIANDPSLLEQAKVNIAAREAKVEQGGLKIDLSGITASPDLVAKAEAKKKPKDQLSAKQAGMPAKAKAKPANQPIA